VYLLPSRLDDQPVRLALTWLGNGHRVIAVDVLPPARFARTNRYERLAHRMVMMEGDDRMRALDAAALLLLAATAMVTGRLHSRPFGDRSSGARGWRSCYSELARTGTGLADQRSFARVIAG
jgi:hypothetical protein